MSSHFCSVMKYQTQSAAPGKITSSAVGRGNESHPSYLCRAKGPNRPRSSGVAYNYLGKEPVVLRNNLGRTERCRETGSVHVALRVFRIVSSTPTDTSFRCDTFVVDQRRKTIRCPFHEAKYPRTIVTTRSITNLVTGVIIR